MDLFAALVALGRRWYLTIVLLVIVGAGTVLAASSVKPDYKATATVIVLAPTQGVGKALNLAPANPYLGAGTAVFANAVSHVMASDSTVQEVVAAGGTSNYIVGQGVSTNGPIINIEATDVSPAVATKTASILISQVSQKATDLQARLKVTPTAYITTQTVTAGDKPSRLQGSRTRVTIAVGAVGIVFTFAVVLLFDSWTMARRARRRRGRSRRDDDSSSSSTSGDQASGDQASGDQASGDQAAGGQDLPLARVRP